MNKRKRKISLSAIKKLPNFIWWLFKCFFIVKSPIEFIWNYIFIKCPKNKKVYFRNGIIINLSDNPEDIVTVFIVFIKKEYGNIAKDSTILDLGANIGTFSVYASIAGAKKIHAYEPNTEAYDLLCKNIELNNLLNIVIPHKKAISSISYTQVKFPAEASPQNKIIEGDECEEYELVNTINLKDIVGENNLDIVDLLKLDCQGIEYDIINNIDLETISRICSIKMEYHNAKEDKIITKLESLGFNLDYKNKESSLMGNLWFSKKTVKDVKRNNKDYENYNG